MVSRNIETDGGATVSPFVFRPTSDYCLIEPRPDNKTEGGIELPDGARGPSPSVGTVIAVGPGHRTEHGVRIEPEVKVGDQVYLCFANVDGKPIRFGDRQYLLARARDVIALAK